MAHPISNHPQPFPHLAAHSSPSPTLSKIIQCALLILGVSGSFALLPLKIALPLSLTAVLLLGMFNAPRTTIDWSWLSQFFPNPSRVQRVDRQQIHELTTFTQPPIGRRVQAAIPVTTVPVTVPNQRRTRRVSTQHRSRQSGSHVPVGVRGSSNQETPIMAYATDPSSSRPVNASSTEQKQPDRRPQGLGQKQSLQAQRVTQAFASRTPAPSLSSPPTSSFSMAAQTSRIPPSVTGPVLRSPQPPQNGPRAPVGHRK